MTGEVLGEFCCDLSDYVLGQLRPHLRLLPERPRSFGWMHPVEWDLLDLPMWLGRCVAGLPVALADHVWAGVVGERVVRPLTDVELSALVLALDDPPMRLAAGASWVAYPALHRRSIECIPVIRAVLTKQTAEEWAAESGCFTARLSESGLPLAEGVATIREWVRCVTRLLEAMRSTHQLAVTVGTHHTPVPPRRNRTDRRRDTPPQLAYETGGQDDGPQPHPLSHGAGRGEKASRGTHDGQSGMLTVNEAAARVGVCHSVVRGWIADGLLSHYRIGATGNRGKILIEEAALDALKATFRVGGGAVQSPVPRATPKPKLKYLRA